MQPPPISRSEIEERIAPGLDELLALWQAEQGQEKARDLDLIAAALPAPDDRPIRVLDLACGPGDVGRAIWRARPNALIDSVDRDPFLISICAGVNGQGGVPGRILLRDLEDGTWAEGLSPGYDIAAMINALHWLTADRARVVLADVHRLLRPGGVFVLAEPASPEPAFASGFAAWKERQPPRYSQANWQRFWSSANAALGYDHVALWGAPGENRIDDNLSVAGWMALVGEAGFASCDVLLRDADEAILAAVRE